VYKSHSSLIDTHTCQNYSRVCWNHSCACWNQIRACCNLIRACQIHTAYGNYTLSTEITFCVLNCTLRVEIPLERVIITLVSVIFTRIRVKITPCVSENHTLRCKITLCGWKLHFACSNHSCACLNNVCACQIHTMRVIKTLQHLQTQYGNINNCWPFFFCFLGGQRGIYPHDFPLTKYLNP
jgi:hypothetical protein